MQSSASIIWRVTIYTTLFLAAVTLLNAPVHAGWLDRGKGLYKEIKEKKKESSKNGGLSREEVASGLKEALKVGTDRVVDRLGKPGGFNKDPKVHIPLPEDLKKVRKVLKKVRQEKLADKLELRLNMAAEKAIPKTKRLFVDAIMALTLKDAWAILNGPDDAATNYFKGKMTVLLRKEMSPVIDESLGEVGAIKSYERTVERYKKIPFVPDVRADLTEYVTEKGIDGIFYYLAHEEAMIRKDPVKRTTELLRKVFGSE